MIIEKIKRAWFRFAPKLIAFLATGLTSSGLIAVATGFGVHIAPELALLIVGGLSSVAGYIQRDNLLTLPPSQLSMKVLAFALTSVSAVTVVLVGKQFGIDLAEHTPAIGFILTAVAGIIGYLQSDQIVVEASGKVGGVVTVITPGK